jgi:NitT/TauT family transport system substrate-binding protein
MWKLVLRALAGGLLAVAAACTPAAPPPSPGVTSVRFATDWRAQAEHGGFYQAKALGLYEKAGLDVRIVQGGPAVNVPQLLAAGAVDLGLGSSSFIALNLVQAKAPARAVMASFQKDPQVLITHPRTDIRTIADMRGKPIMISDASIGAFWVWLKAKYGFTDDQVRKYTFNTAPFLTDKTAIQQGYLTSEPYTLEKEGGIEPQIFLLADEGFPSYAGLVLARDSLIAENPGAVRAFVAASIEGWRSYLYGDPAPADALILKDNPDMRPDILAQAREKMRTYGMVGEEDGPIGAMTDAQWQAFFETTSESGVYAKDLAWREAYTLAFLPAAK